jgi:hypothetical protein
LKDKIQSRITSFGKILENYCIRFLIISISEDETINGDLKLLLLEGGKKEAD